jgi:hypothetical protein
MIFEILQAIGTFRNCCLFFFKTFETSAGAVIKKEVIGGHLI